MNRFRLLPAALLLATLLAGSARAGDAEANPKYTAWAKFKPGSSETVEADIQSKGVRYHLRTTQTLLSVNADEAVVQTDSTSTASGQKENRSTKREAFKATAKPDGLKQTGHKEVEAMGKTFKCRVCEGSGKSAAANGGISNDGLKATIYLCDEVPGGLVRLDAVGADGSRSTFILTAMDIK